MGGAPSRGGAGAPTAPSPSGRMRRRAVAGSGQHGTIVSTAAMLAGAAVHGVESMAASAPRVLAASPAQGAVDLEQGLSDKQHALPNPGFLDDLSRGAQLQVPVFDGFNCDLTKIFETGDGSFQVAQNVAMGRTTQRDPDNYHIVTTLLKGPRMFQGVLFQGGVVAGTLVDRTEGGAELRLDAQLPGDPEQAVLNGSAMVPGTDYSVGFKGGLGAQGLTLGMNYFQSVTERLALGADMTWLNQYGKLDYNLVGRYRYAESAMFVAVCNVPGRALQTMYKQRLDDRITLYSDFSAHPSPAGPGQEPDGSLESTVAVGCEYHIRMENAGVNPRTGQAEFIPYTTMTMQCKQDWTIDVLLEQLAVGGQAKLKIAASLNHPKNEYRFGVGFDVQY